MTLFFILSFITFYSSLLLITNKNPIYSVLSLVLIFISGSLLLLLLGLDFLPFVFIIVYVGAVAVLFLFVVIILDIKIPKSTTNNYLIFYVLCATFLIFQALVLFEFQYGGSIFNIFKNTPDIYYTTFSFENEYLEDFDSGSNISYLGQLLYTNYILHFVIGGLILLVAIIGAIILTRNTTSKSLKQISFKQYERSPHVGKYSNHVGNKKS